MTAEEIDDRRLRRLCEVAGLLVGERDIDVVFERILEVAREVTGARYAALGVLNAQRTELERFQTAGMDDETRSAIGDLPRGRGVLGALMLDPRPLRLTEIAEHPGSYGFPAGHPQMHSFLGVALRVRGAVSGSLYLADKDVGAFTDGDEQLASVLAGWAAAAIEAARAERLGAGSRVAAAALELRGSVSIVRDATEQRVVEEQRVRDSRSQAVEEIVSGLEAIVWEGTAPDRESMTYLGGRREAFLGYSPEQWMTPGFWLSVVHADDRLTALTSAESARESETFELEYRLIDADGAVHQVRDIVAVRRDHGGEIIRLSGVILDMTERRELEARIAKMQKMEAVGQLAGGIAHDFNNLLTIVSGYARRLRGRDDLAQAHGDLDQVIAAADRAADLTRQLLTFARRGQSDRELLDVNETVRTLAPMLHRLMAADIDFDFQLDPGAPHVLMARTELEQLLMNLIINASDAMLGGGTLTVSTAAHEAPERDARGRSVPGERDLRMTVTDTGVGIAPDVRDRVFEPFFTTKAGKGTGMGLATVYGIVEHAGGSIELDTTVGIGTTFAVTLPGVASAAADPQTHTAASLGTVLLVEDEAVLRQLVVTILEEQGYTVLQAGNGLDAIELAERHRGPLALLITDVVMPRLSGPELAQRLRALRPGLEVLFMSGYNDSRLVSRGIEEADVNLLVKPFTSDQLFAAVRSLTAPPADA